MGLSFGAPLLSFAPAGKRGYFFIRLRPGSGVAMMPLRPVYCTVAPLDDNNTREKEDITCCPYRSDLLSLSVPRSSVC